ncbi:hypothetical protein N3Z17_07430 (plasmid) [Candidatus Bandiella numerosa]|uniref:hypothetical protein n=1 Tax=Candidatus Bandiella numerosa TaxID=2570586 RepID=UPI00249E7181|nr:hypothetical protein [Candidatus Bandiella numerosa]WHA05663.1 hypothetical protein N3Z17_07430 [Candidatus Bandiella numerosa]
MSKYWIIGIIIFTIGVYNQKGTATIMAIIVAIGLYNYFGEKPFKIENFQSDENYLNDRYVGQDINLVLKDFEASGFKCSVYELTKYDLLVADREKHTKQFVCRYTTNTISLQPFYNYSVSVGADADDKVSSIGLLKKFIIGK